MKSDRNIVFLGMMGSGKTSIGFLVSKKLKLDFYDVDHYIENKLKMKISKIFKNKGEKFFREYEEKITLELMKNRGIVVSLGGGAFLNKNISKDFTIIEEGYYNVNDNNNTNRENQKILEMNLSEKISEKIVKNGVFKEFILK